LSKECIWYISKYVVPPNKTTIGGRGYMLMRELVKIGHKCLIFASDSSEYSDVPDLKTCYQEELMDGMSFWWLQTLKYDGARSLRRILSWIHFEWRLFRMPKSELPVPDAIIVSSLSILTILNGFLLRKKFRCKLIFEIRDIWPLTLTEEGGFSKFNPLIFGLGFIEKLGYKYSDIIVGTMPNLEEHVAEVIGYKRKVSCVPMGLDINKIDDILPLPLGYKQKYLLDKPFVVAHAGAIGITNALETFFLCAESLVDRPHIHFFIVGEGYLKTEYQERFKHLPNLTFAPKVPRKMVQSVLKECDLLYFSTPSSLVWKYGQSLNKVIDYMLSARPIVASYSGFPSMINEAECGSYVTAGDLTCLRNEIIYYSELSEVELNELGSSGKDWLLANRNYSTLALSYKSIIFPD
jgi:hypothetical protein